MQEGGSSGGTRKVNGASWVPQKTIPAVLRGVDGNRSSEGSRGKQRGLKREREVKTRPPGMYQKQMEMF